jgi:predicted GNAT family N-acyltransferase
MKSDVLNNSVISIKQPRECSEKELNDFHEKVVKGGKVSLNGLLNRIKNCELIAFCYFNNKLIGISSIKKPNQGYLEDIIKKAKLDREYNDLNFEIGYSFTEPEFRKNGISKELKLSLLEKMNSRKGIIFSTTAIPSSQNFLKENGFEKRGESYDGENDIGISYFEKLI